MKDMDGKRLNNSDLCNLAENYVEIINNSGIEELKSDIDYSNLIELQHQLKDKSDNSSSEESITLRMRLTSVIKNIYRRIVAKEIETNSPQWSTLSQKIFENNETFNYDYQIH